MTRAAFVAPWRSDRFVSPGLQNVCHLHLRLGCAKFVLFLVKCCPVSVHTFGGGPASIHVLEPFVGEGPCLMFCRWVHMPSQVVLRGSTFGSRGSS